MVIVIDPQVSGISGNMIIGALVDLGADSNELKEVMEKSASIIGKVDVNFKKIAKNGISSTYCSVRMLDKNTHVSYTELVNKINELDLDENIKKTSINIFKRIADGECRVHGKSLEEIHFHEVGASDAVADVIGSVYAYYSLNLDECKIIGLPISVGGGQVESEHGLLPVPAPAVLEILKGLNLRGGPVSSELATPTGCAIYAELCDEFMEFLPQMTQKKVAYGAGSKDFTHPNVLRIIEGCNPVKSDMVDVIETNIDHLTGEEIGYLFNRLLDEGANDVSVTPMIMKKNRQGSLLKVISSEEKRDHLVDVIFKETGSLGIRISPNIHRGIAKREFRKETVNVNGFDFEVTFKIAYVNGRVISRRAEYEDLKNIALKTKLPLRQVREMVQ